MKTVWKFKLNWQDTISIKMPTGAKILSAAVQGSDICLWALVFSDNPTEHRHFRISGTGFQIFDSKQEFIETVHVDGFVWHIFEVLT